MITSSFVNIFYVLPRGKVNIKQKFKTIIRRKVSPDIRVKIRSHIIAIKIGKSVARAIVPIAASK